MKDHRMPFLGIGAASIVLVLTIVSLSVFATLTISSANGDYTLSQKNLERTTNYYKASNEVNCTLSQRSLFNRLIRNCGRIIIKQKIKNLT